MAAPIATLLVATPMKRSTQVTPPRPVRRAPVAGRWRVVRRTPAAPCSSRRPPVRAFLLAGVAAVVALVVYGLGAVSAPAPAVPDALEVVRVLPGDTLSGIAARMAPGSDVSAVVDRIRELNALDGAEVRPGQPLRVPSAQR